MILLSEITNTTDPWTYLNGTNIAFGIDAGEDNKVLVAIFHLFQNTGLTIGLILILASVVGMIWSGNSQERAQQKNAIKQRFVGFLVLGGAVELLTLLMKICNIVFAIS